MLLAEISLRDPKAQDTYVEREQSAKRGARSAEYGARRFEQKSPILRPGGDARAGQTNFEQKFCFATRRRKLPTPSGSKVLSEEREVRNTELGVKKSLPM